MKVSIVMVARFEIPEKRGIAVANINEKNIRWNFFSCMLFYTK